MHTEAMAPENYRNISKLATRLGKFPLTKKSSLRLLDDSEETLTLLVNDIDNAKELITMEFYIWDVGGKADDVSAALIRAARRGVQCYVLVDAIGSSRFYPVIGRACSATKAFILKVPCLFRFSALCFVVQTFVCIGRLPSLTKNRL